MDFTKADLTAMLLATSKDGLKYPLNGILMEKGRMVATDGHRLHILEASDDVLPSEVPSKPIILDSSDLVDLRKAMKSGDIATMAPDPEVRGGHMVRAIDAGSVSVKVMEIDGKYPDYRRAMPAANKKPTATICLNAQYLMDACSAVLKAGTKSSSHEMKIEVFDEFEPIRITNGNLTCILMPMRV